MLRSWQFHVSVVVLIGVGALPLLGQAPLNGTPDIDLSAYSTLDKAVTAKLITTGTAKVRAAGYLGIHVTTSGQQLIISEVDASSPASKAGLKPRDVLLKIDGTELAALDTLRELLQAKQAGDKVSLTYRRGGETREATATMAATSRPVAGGGGTGTKGTGGKGGKGGGPPMEVQLPLWTKDAYRLAVIIIEFADIKRNEKTTTASWDQALFSSKTYRKENATGQKVHGSLNDYFQEQSYGKFRIEGTVFDPVQVAKKRGEYVQGSGTSNKTAVLTDALTQFEAREAKGALSDFDGLCFVYAGSRVQSNAGSVYYPHRGSIMAQGKRLPYILCPEGGSEMETISVFALEFGKLLGLPHLAARTENAGSEGLGVWCMMSNGAGTNGRPMHLCAWCKEQLGWLSPTVVNPTTKQRLILNAVHKAPTECLKVLVRLDGSEYFLLENRAAHGFDAELPGQGLLIWRVAGDRPILEEAHGVTGPNGPRVHLDAVPYPSKANNAFTPTTTPSSRSVTGGGLPVHITNIRRLADGRITLFLGFDYH